MLAAVLLICGGHEPGGGAGGSSGPPAGLQSGHGMPAPSQPSWPMGRSGCSSHTQRSPRHNLNAAAQSLRDPVRVVDAAQVHDFIRGDLWAAAAILAEDPQVLVRPSDQRRLVWLISHAGPER